MVNRTKGEAFRAKSSSSNVRLNRETRTFKRFEAKKDVLHNDFWYYIYDQAGVEFGQVGGGEEA